MFIFIDYYSTYTVDLTYISTKGRSAKEYFYIYEKIEYNGVYMMTLKQCQDKDEWDEYVLENGGHPFQLWGWGELKVAHGWKADRLFFYIDNDISGAVQVLVKPLPWPFQSLAYIPRGPIVSDDNREGLLNELPDYIKRVHKSVAISVEPDSEEFTAPEGWIKSKTRILPPKTILLDLKKSDSGLLSAMAKKTRQYIRKSAAEDIVIKRVKTKKQLQECMDIYHETSKRAGFSLHDDRYYTDAFDKLEDNSQIFASYVDDKPIAFLWLAISEKTAYELYGGMNDLGQNLRANYNLKWHAIRKCQGWGIERYDFGGLIDGGVSTFKLAWTDAPTELAGTFDKPLSKFYKTWITALPKAKKIIRKIKNKKQ